MQTIQARFSGMEPAEAALHALRSANLDFRLKRLEGAEVSRSDLAAAMPQGTVSAQELTGSAFRVFPLLGGRSMMQLDHAAKNEVRLTVSVSDRDRDRVKEVLRRCGGRFI